MNATQEFYSPDEVAEHLDLHVRTVRRYIREGRLKATRIGKQYRIAASDFDAFVGSDQARLTGADRRRRTLVSTTVDIDAISPDETYRVTTAVTGAFKGTQDSAHKRVDCIYYEEQGRLRIVVNAELETANAVLGLINFLLNQDRPVQGGS